MAPSLGGRLIAGLDVCDKTPVARATERQVCTNLWAYLQWLQATGQATLAGRADLRRWAEGEPERWSASIQSFARLPDAPSRLLPPPPCKGSLVLRSLHPGSRRAWTTDALAREAAEDLPSDLAHLLAAEHPAAALTDAAAVLLLDADLRPDDRVLLADATLWPWAWALREGATLIVCPDAEPAALPGIAEEERASLLVASGAASRIRDGAVARRAGGPASR